MLRKKDKFILNEINILKGIAICCVVLFHTYPKLPYGSAWHYIRDILMLFQMPAFMYASGFLHGISGTEITSKSDYYVFIKKKFKRLMLPYITLSLIILFMKYYGGYVASLKMPVDHDFWKYLILNPGGGFAPFLWFIYVLFIIFLIFPIIKHIVNNSYVLLLLLLIIYFIRVPVYYYFNLDYLKAHFVFFYLGYIYSKNNFKKINVYSESLAVICILAFVIDYIAIRMIWGATGNAYVFLFRKLSLGVFGVFSIYYLSIIISNKINILSRMLGYLGLCSAAIYLIHTIPIGIVNIVLLQYIKLPNDLHIVYIVMYISGMIVPILVLKYILQKNRVLSLFILGK